MISLRSDSGTTEKGLSVGELFDLLGDLPRTRPAVDCQGEDAAQEDLSGGAGEELHPVSRRE